MGSLQPYPSVCCRPSAAAVTCMTSVVLEGCTLLAVAYADASLRLWDTDKQSCLLQMSTESAASIVQHVMPKLQSMLMLACRHPDPKHMCWVALRVFKPSQRTLILEGPCLQSSVRPGGAVGSAAQPTHIAFAPAPAEEPGRPGKLVVQLDEPGEAAASSRFVAFDLHGSAGASSTLSGIDMQQVRLHHSAIYPWCADPATPRSMQPRPCMHWSSRHSGSKVCIRSQCWSHLLRNQPSGCCCCWSEGYTCLASRWQVNLYLCHGAMIGRCQPWSLSAPGPSLAAESRASWRISR